MCGLLAVSCRCAVRRGVGAVPQLTETLTGALARCMAGPARAERRVGAASFGQWHGTGVAAGGPGAVAVAGAVAAAPDRALTTATAAVQPPPTPDSVIEVIGRVCDNDTVQEASRIEFGNTFGAAARGRQRGRRHR